MKTKLLLWIITYSLAFGCKTEPEYIINFCDNEEMETCKPDRRQFELGSRIYVKLVAPQGFEANKITGTVYKIQNQKKLKMGSRDFDLSSGANFILQDIPFDEFGMQALGTFEVSFTDAQGSTIATDQLDIDQP